jgi:hypothetical protein
MTTEATGNQEDRHAGEVPHEALVFALPGPVLGVPPRVASFDALAPVQRFLLGGVGTETILGPAGVVGVLDPMVAQTPVPLRRTRGHDSSFPRWSTTRLGEEACRQFRMRGNVSMTMKGMLEQ